MPAKLPNEVARQTQTCVDELCIAAHKDRFSFFLGAGASYGAGMPLWGEFACRLLARSVEDDLRPSVLRPTVKLWCDHYATMMDTSLMSVIREAKARLGPDERNFLTTVRTVLYDGVKIPLQVPKSSLVGRLATILANAKYQTRDVITYNYDDVLEWHLRESLQREVRTVKTGSDMQHITPGDRVVIYYVHGCIPHGPWGGETPIVAGEDEYYELRRWELGWRNLVQLGALMGSRAIMVGLSLTDPNVRWLVETARRETKGHSSSGRHVMIDRLETIDEIVTSGLRIGATIGADEAEWLRLVKVQSRARMGDVLGVRTVWVADWHEVPEVLAQVFPVEA